MNLFTKLKNYINTDLLLKYTIDNKWIGEKGKRFLAFIDIYFHYEDNDNVNSENNEQKSAYYMKIILSFF